jgi:hypothetical protein
MRTMHAGRPTLTEKLRIFNSFTGRTDAKDCFKKLSSRLLLRAEIITKRMVGYRYSVYVETKDAQRKNGMVMLTHNHKSYSVHSRCNYLRKYLPVRT